MLVGMLFQILVACALGNFVEITVRIICDCIHNFLTANQIRNSPWKSLISAVDVHFQHDRVYDAVLQIDWNLLPTTDQYMYKLFVCGCQNPNLLSIGGFYDLNLDTSVKVIIT